MTCFYCGDRFTWVLCGWSKLAWLCARGENKLGYLWVSRLIYSSFCVGLSKLNMFLYTGRTWLVDCVEINELSFVGVGKIGLVFVYGPNMTWFW